jgi:hypothetical protein
MVWEDEPEPAHWRIRSQHPTREESRETRLIYLAIMFPFALFMSAIVFVVVLIMIVVGLLLGVFLALLFYGTILVFLPVYATVGFFVIWLLHFWTRLTGIGPDWLKGSPRGFIAEKAEGFREIVMFALTWRWKATDELNESESGFGLLDHRGPYKSYEYESLPVENDQQVIRVLDLLPGQKDSPLRCRIRHISLKLDEPAFEAISENLLLTFS